MRRAKAAGEAKLFPETIKSGSVVEFPKRPNTFTDEMYSDNMEPHIKKGDELYFRGVFNLKEVDNAVCWVDLGEKNYVIGVVKLLPRKKIQVSCSARTGTLNYSLSDVKITGVYYGRRQK